MGQNSPDKFTWAQDQPAIWDQPQSRTVSSAFQLYHCRGSRGSGISIPLSDIFGVTANTDCLSISSRTPCFTFLFNLITAVHPSLASLQSLAAQPSSPHCPPFWTKTPPQPSPPSHPHTPWSPGNSTTPSVTSLSLPFSLGLLRNQTASVGSANCSLPLVANTRGGHFPSQPPFLQSGGRAHDFLPELAASRPLPLVS